MKKVGILVNSIGYGGNERSAVNIATALKNFCDVFIIIQEDRGNHYRYEGKVINLNTPCADTLVGKAFNALRRIRQLKRVQKKYRFDTLFIILPISNPINYLKLKCKKIVSCRDCGDLIRNTNRYIKMTKNSDSIVCNSFYQAEYLSNSAPFLKNKVKVIYNILDIDKIQRLKEEPLEDSVKAFIQKRKFIVSSGRFADAKGLNNLLKSFSLLVKKDDNIRLVMIGDGELKEKITNLIHGLDLEEKVLLLGFQDNPFKFIAHSDAFVLPSFYEGFPNTLVEAMACGTPVISTDCLSGPAEILCGNADDRYQVTDYGILVSDFAQKESNWDPADIRPEHQDFAEAIETILFDHELAVNLSQNAIRRIDAFKADKIIADWLEQL